MDLFANLGKFSFLCKNEQRSTPHSLLIMCYLGICYLVIDHRLLGIFWFSDSFLY